MMKASGREPSCQPSPSIERITNFPAKRIWGYDFARCMAILLVVFSHLQHSIPDSVPVRFFFRYAGYEGVEIFFSLSGILIGGVVFRDLNTGQFNLLHFWRRRWLRTIPAFFVCICLLALWHQPQLSDFLLRLFFLQNLTPSNSLHSYDFFPVYWSLAVEEFFYIMFGIFLFIIRKKNILLYSVLFYFSILAFRTFFLFYNSEQYLIEYNALWVPLRLDALMMGVILSLWLMGNPNIRQRCVALALGLIALSLSAFIEWETLGSRSIEKIIWFFPANSIGTALFVAGLSVFLEPPKFLHRYLAKGVTYIALISYSLYLYHNEPALYALEHRLIGYDVTGWILLIGTALGVSSYYLIERPVMRWRDTRRLAGQHIPTH